MSDWLYCTIWCNTACSRCQDAMFSSCVWTTTVPWTFGNTLERCTTTNTRLEPNPLPWIYRCMMWAGIAFADSVRLLACCLCKLSRAKPFGSARQYSRHHVWWHVECRWLWTLLRWHLVLLQRNAAVAHANSNCSGDPASLLSTIMITRLMSGAFFFHAALYEYLIPLNWVGGTWSARVTTSVTLTQDPHCGDTPGGSHTPQLHTLNQTVLPMDIYQHLNVLANVVSAERWPNSDVNTVLTVVVNIIVLSDCVYINMPYSFKNQMFSYNYN